MPLDQDQLNAAFVEHRDAVFRQARMIVTDSDDAADVLQNTFEKAYRHRDRFDDGRSVRAWLLGIASNEALHLARQRRLRRWLPLVDRQPATQDPEVDRALWAAVQSLPLKHRVVVALFYVHGFSIDEISGLLDVSYGTVGSRLHTARRALRSALVAAGPEVPA